MRLAFQVPGPIETVAGSFVYDRAVIAGLRAAGHHVDIVEPGRTVPPHDLRLVDAPGLAEMGDVGGAIGLVHHPVAIDGADRATEVERLGQLRHVIAASPRMGRLLTAEFGIPAERISVVEPGTDAAARAVGSGGCAILSIGTLTSRKGHDVLLRALARLPDLDFSLTIIGAGPEADALGALAAELGMSSRTRFAGEVTGPALERFWQAADLFALATHYEGYGMVVAEALRRGLPVAVCGGGAAADLLDPRTGVSVAPGDHAALSLALRRLIHDRPLRRAMADAAWARGQELPDWPAQAARFAAVLEAHR